MLPPNKYETIAIVLAHGKAVDVCRRHLPVWQNLAAEVVFFSPVDDPLPPGDRSYSIGKSKAYSADTNLRCREALRFASLTRFEYVLLCEYDSLVFGDIPAKYYPDWNGVTAPAFPNSDPKFIGKRYLHFPQLYSRDAAQAVVSAMDAMPLDSEHGFTDRYVGLAVERASCITLFNLIETPYVYTQNEIDDPKLPQALAAYKNGARWSHGIKTRKVFEALRAAAT